MHLKHHTKYIIKLHYYIMGINSKNTYLVVIHSWCVKTAIKCSLLRRIKTKVIMFLNYNFGQS